LDLDIPFDCDVVQDYAFANVPPKLELTVYRKQPDDTFAIFWTGIVRGFEVADRLGKVKFRRSFSLALSGECRISITRFLAITFCTTTLPSKPRANTFDAVRPSDRRNGNFAYGDRTGGRRSSRRRNHQRAQRRTTADPYANVGSLITIGYGSLDIVSWRRS
jgi:hypothetical protein